MFCAFQGPPNIVRLYGRGRFVTLYDEGFDELAALFPETRGARAVIVVDVDRVSDSCGYGVPLMALEGERDLLPQYMERKGVEGQADYRRLKNRTSIDGLPAFDMDPVVEARRPSLDPVNHDVRRRGGGVTRRRRGRSVQRVQTILLVVLPERAG